jgi:fibro-slime domain-containing protein
MLRTSIGLVALFVHAALLACSASNEGDGSSVNGGSGNQASGGNANTGGTAPSLPTAGTTGSGTGGLDLGSSGGSGGTAPAATYCDGNIKGYVRDFSPYTHLDFEPFVGINDATGQPYPTPRTLAATAADFVDTAIVGATLGENQKPTYGSATATPTTNGAALFASWYSDTPGVNLGMELEFAFEEDPARPGVFFYENNKFFPVNGKLMGAAGAAENPDPTKRENEGFPNQTNYGFTTELHLSFEYAPGQVFTFFGDDDVFVFINKQLVINLGGVHTALTKSIALDTLGLTPGQQYPLDFFHAERHRVNSNFRIETSLKFVNCGVIVVK